MVGLPQARPPAACTAPRPPPLRAAAGAHVGAVVGQGRQRVALKAGSLQLDARGRLVEHSEPGRDSALSAQLSALSPPNCSTPPKLRSPFLLTYSVCAGARWESGRDAGRDAGREAGGRAAHGHSGRRACGARRASSGRCRMLAHPDANIAVGQGVNAGDAAVHNGQLAAIEGSGRGGNGG